MERQWGRLVFIWFSDKLHHRNSTHCYQLYLISASFSLLCALLVERKASYSVYNRILSPPSHPLCFGKSHIFPVPGNMVSLGRVCCAPLPLCYEGTYVGNWLKSLSCLFISFSRPWALVLISPVAGNPFSKGICLSVCKIKPPFLRRARPLFKVHDLTDLWLLFTVVSFIISVSVHVSAGCLVDSASEREKAECCL